MALAWLLQQKGEESEGERMLEGLASNAERD
jgi:hypothetical protein